MPHNPPLGRWVLGSNFTPLTKSHILSTINSIDTLYKKGQTMTREHFSTHEDKTVSSAVLRAAKKGAAVVALVPVAVLGVAGCSSNESSAPTTANSEEWTQVWDDGFGVELDSTGKRCDGPNLLYRSGGRGGNIAVSPNDPQCTGKTPEATATDLATAIPTPLPTHE